ncbi:hypothetical protein acsn021_35130 [Anaerocolumna cellulosilytica]|uniref:Uncharacterized protein n=1 Tax=Anaerocolumna cellulosilytica TaxID=433286 RepID=A0A6S6QZ70_9FIRM|nr:hypothetical protein [Anaerocolumna cellulosilytica]MBB5195413.1 hypothetical protein [Anaerocolumna cellulosilytica]BCJ95944.1 hypothetical protein acsn021_35130 [Anaerocolumna cellulosilytica]
MQYIPIDEQNHFQHSVTTPEVVKEVFVTYDKLQKVQEKEVLRINSI